MGFSVRVYFDDCGNLHKTRLIGQVRRIADEFGYSGIVGKRGQTNKCIEKNGYLRIVWPTHHLACQYQDAVAELWGDRVSTKQFKTKRKHI